METFTGFTYQDWARIAEDQRARYAAQVVAMYQGSEEFARACEANCYFAGKNPGIAQRRKMEVKGSTDSGKARLGVVEGTRIANNFLYRFVTQQNQFLLANGLTLPDKGKKARLGAGFDKVLEQIGEKALLHGVCWGFWNVDHLECVKACEGHDTGFVGLLDEMTSEPKAGIQFWRIATGKPMYMRIYEVEGVTLYRVALDGTVEQIEARREYVQKVRRDALGTMFVGGENYGVLPIIPMYANDLKESELTQSIKAKIDAYDVIMSDFSDNLERTNDIYWAINNFGGTSDEVIDMLAEINRIKATYVQSGVGGQATAEPHTIEVPYQARSMALEMLEKALYKDYMALNMSEMTGGSLTNVAIKTATANLNLKANRYEWQVFTFCQKLLRLIGVETEEISFRRQTIANESETVQDIYTMRADITQKKALELNPYILEDEIEDILRDSEAEKETGMPGMKELEEEVNDDEEGEEKEGRKGR